jgi:hypothetical protein
MHCASSRFSGKMLLAAFSLLLFSATYAQTPSDSLSPLQDSLKAATTEDLKIGERLFYGLIRTEGKSVSCVACHNMKYIDTLNWNPSAFDISTEFRNKKASDLASALRNPTGNKATLVHADINLSDEQMFQVKAFMNTIADKGPPVRKPLVNRLFFFVLSLVIAFALTLDLIFFKKIRYKLISLGLLLVMACYQVNVLAHEAMALGRSQNWAPLQPVKFSHRVHVEGNKIDCKYCHSTVEYSKAASIPSENVCMNCHILVREGPNSGKAEIAKLLNAYESKHPIQWIKVHSLPDHVFFSHAQHVGAGKVQCAECHGSVEKMDVIRQESDLSMGWCIKCHREREVQFFDNNFYKQYKELHDKIKSGKVDKATVEKIGGTDCMKCHY